ncbi:HAD family hydrolase [Actinomadura verrucosospora]|uniref:HAD superfamily hydrolase-like protein n=1 Tax=Actinomadura verrucosospora TaxID=46165 RepID=A0A7D3ZQC6_ACTVE|nr:HAD family hydrolase [Actinomadura verrucosospora]QKG24743.1 HAD superfamily hydrolase-like protein [Actinomadura verrucosospora]
MSANEAGHPLLDNVYRIVADGTCSVLSLDIFDTVLWRRVPRPTDAFALLAARLREEGLCPAWVTDATLRRMRIGAEERARRSRDTLGTEVSLFDIWRAMPEELFGSAELDRLVAAEVALEREITVVDLDVAEVVKAARKQDIDVVLVSDTYFTQDQLAHLLDRPELGPMEDVRIFRSNQHGTDKASGLWEIVLRDLGRSPEQIVHVGDNEVADDEVPAGLGVRTVHYRRLDEAYTEVLEREHEPLSPAGEHAPDLDERHGDLGLTSLRAKAVQAGGPFATSALETAHRYGAGVLGPLLTGFAEWIAERAVANGTRMLWCPMREGELLSTLINDAARARGWDVEARPVWLSRFVTSLAGLDPFDTDKVHAFVRSGYQLTVRQALSVLELQPGDVPGLATELDTVIDNGDIADRVSKALTETPHLCNRLAVTVTAARERLIRSLREAGALDGTELTLVDLGWGGTIQRQLARVLRIAGIDIAPSGYYLATDARAERLYLAGLRAEGYLAQAGHPAEVAATVTRSPEIVEQCVNALCGSLIGFTDEGAPVLGDTADSPSQNAERRTVQDGILAFQRRWNRYVAASEGTWPSLTLPAARERLSRILISALRSPTADEAAVFGNWVHEDNFGSTLVTTLLPADLKPAIPYLSPGDLEDLHMRDSFWPALLAASDTGLGAAARAIADGAIRAADFDPSGESYETRLRYRTADDRWHEPIRRRVRINHNGLSFARFAFEHHDTVDISLAIPGRPAIVRVDWIEARVVAGGRRTEQVLRWDKPEDFVGLHYADCRYLGGNLMEFDTSYAAVWLPLARRAGAPVVSSGQITIAFAMLPQSMTGMAPRMPVDRKAARAARTARLTDRLREEYRAAGVRGVAAGAGRVARRKLGDG